MNLVAIKTNKTLMTLKSKNRPKQLRGSQIFKVVRHQTDKICAKPSPLMRHHLPKWRRDTVSNTPVRSLHSFYFLSAKMPQTLSKHVIWFSSQCSKTKISSTCCWTGHKIRVVKTQNCSYYQSTLTFARTTKISSCTLEMLHITTT